MESERDILLDSLAQKALEILDKSSNEIERACWMIVHEYCNGSLPVEYDIREIDEDLYLAVLNRVKTLIGS